ncbi:MAG TPA: hypothetical protein VK436_03270, partial [Methanocella sp.]|nr:hypothetical protein [Methanocella sp.]
TNNNAHSNTFSDTNNAQRNTSRRFYTDHAADTTVDTSISACGEQPTSSYQLPLQITINIGQPNPDRRGKKIAVYYRSGRRI